MAASPADRAAEVLQFVVEAYQPFLLLGAPRNASRPRSANRRYHRACRSPIWPASARLWSRSTANSRIVSSIQKRSPVWRSEALVDERLKEVEVGVARRLRPRRGCSRRRRRRGARRAASRRRSSRSYDHSIVARSVCWRGSASRPPLSRSSRCASRSRICAGERTLRAGGGELECERQVVEPAAELGDRLVRLEPRALAEELDRLRLGERRHRVLDLAADPQQLPARDQEPQVGAGLEQLRELGRRLDDLLEVVEQQQKLALADVLGEAVLRPERLRDRLGHERGVAEGGKADPEDPGLERRARARRRPRSRAASCPSRPDRRA